VGVQVLLTPVAIAAGRRLAERLFNGQAGLQLDYSNIPSVVFSHPPVGHKVHTVKPPKFDIRFGENIFLLLIFVSWPPLKVFGGVPKIRTYQLIKVCNSIWTQQGHQNNTFLQVSNLYL
jgi:hypothetical protein